MAQNLPSKIGKYEVLGVLGQGGMGTVYKAIDPLIGRPVAIKVIVADGIDDPELLKRFYREAKAVGNLQHPNIVIVYDLGEEHKNPYLVMEYLDGEPLNKIIASHRDFPLLQKLSIVAKVCRALFYAHQRDIVHRDVKPANVMLLKDGQVKLLDFGIARLGNSSYRKTETRKGQVMGTISYIAPEILHEEIADGRSDVYSTGVMLFELLTYRLPFEASNLDSLIAKKMQGNPPPPLSKYIENYPPGLDEILVRALAKDREERHGSAQDLAIDLERLIERLKRDMVSQYVERAREYISIAELGQARDLLSEVLRIDTQHTAAKQLLYEVQQSIQKQKRLEHIRQLQQHSREALAQKQFDDASRFAEEAIKLDDTDPDSLNLRESIQQSKLQAQQIKKLLHLAEIAQQSGELGVLQKAVSDALNLDPDDPQALVFQASVIRLQAEQEKESKVREWLTAARRELAAHHFDAVQENILKAEALDPHREDIPALKQMVLAGRQQETRARQQQEFCRDIQQELDGNNPVSAKELAEKALRVFPGEPSLLRLKSAAESQIEAELRRKYIAEQIASASKLLELGEPSRALTIAEQANRQFPTDTRLRDFLHVVRQSVQEDALKRNQQAVLTQAREEMRQKRFAEAVKILEAGQIKYPDLSEMGDLLTLARREQELLVRKGEIAGVNEQARTLLSQRAFVEAISLLKRTLGTLPDPSLEELLQSAQAQAVEFNASLETLQKETLARLKSGHSTEAQDELRSVAGKFGGSSSFRELLQRVDERVKEEQENSKHVARVLDEASVYLREGALQQAEAALTACWARAPQDPNVIAFSSQLVTAKAAAEKERELRPPVEPEVPTDPEQKKNALAETVRFMPAAAVADLTPPGGSSISTKIVDPRNLPAAVSPTIGDEKHTPLPGDKPPIPVSTTLERLWKQLTWKHLLLATAAAGLILIVLSIRHFWPKALPAPPSTPARIIAMHISTVPKGAKILVDHEFRGTSEVHVDLTFGNHQLQASMPGYKDATTELSLKSGSASDAVLTLDPLAPQAWIASPDLEDAEVWLDGTLFGKLEVGSLQLPNFPEGHHTARIAVPPKIGPDVVLSVDSRLGTLPKIAPQTGTHQLQVVVIRSNGAVMTFKGSVVPVGVILDGSPVGQLTATGLDIKNVNPGIHEFAFHQKNVAQRISLTIEPRPTIYIVVFSPQDVGSVLVETGENSARLYVDGHLTSKRTVNGQLRIPNLSPGKHEVRVVKDGFNDSLPQTVQVVSAQEAKLKFVLVPKATAGPPMATLEISNAPRGGEVFVDKLSVGTVPAGGEFSYDHVTTGYHTIEIKKEGYQPISMSRNFAVGGTVTINGDQTALLTGILEITYAFPGRVTLSRDIDKSPIYAISGAPLNLQPGTYTIMTSAQGTVTPSSVRVVSGEKQSITLSLR